MGITRNITANVVGSGERLQRNVNAILPAIDTGFLLDNYPAKAAYSMRQLSSQATTCLRLRRASDNAESDFGFVDKWVDSDSIAAWLSGSTGHIVKWYNQASMGLDAEQDTQSRQPEYIASAQNLRPGVNFDGANHYLRPDTIMAGGDQSNNVLIFVIKPDVDNPLGIFDSAPNTLGALRNYDVGNWEITRPNKFAVSLNLASNAPFLLGLRHYLSGAGSDVYCDYYKNGDDSIVYPSGTDGGAVWTLNTIGTINTGFAFYDGAFFEVIFYASDFDINNYSAVRNDINAHWGIY